MSEGAAALDRPVITVAGRPIGAGHPTLLLAEVGSNHNRDLGLAHKLIDAAGDSGWDGVKFQLFRAEYLYPANCGVIDTASGPMDFFAVLGRNELPVEWLVELKQHAEARGLVFLCTPFDEQAVAQLVEVGIAALKIASPELNYLGLLRAAAQTGRPLLCSTGISRLSDIEEALDVIRGVAPAAEVALFQCTTAYPTPPEQINALAIDTMRRAFGVPVGLSDHSMDPVVVPSVAVAVGAAMIEKHYTLSRAMPGPDHPFAIEVEEMKRMAAAVRALDAVPLDGRLDEVMRLHGEARVHAILGHGRKEIMPCEAELYPCDKRSIHALTAIAVGETLSESNIRVVRSERNLRPGLHPRHLEDVLGARVTAPVAPGEGLQWNHLLRR